MTKKFSVPIHPLPLDHSLPHWKYPTSCPQSGASVTMDGWTCTDTASFITQSPQLTIVSALGAVHSEFRQMYTNIYLSFFIFFVFFSKSFRFYHVRLHSTLVICTELLWFSIVLFTFVFPTTILVSTGKGLTLFRSWRIYQNS